MEFKNKRMELKMKQLIDYMHSYLKKYEFRYDLNNTDLKIFTMEDCNGKDDIIENLEKSLMFVNVSFVTCDDDLRYKGIHINKDKKRYNLEDDDIIWDVEATIYTSYQNLYHLIIDCGLDFGDVKKCITTILGHEIGHVATATKHVGCTLREYKEFTDNGNEYEKFKNKKEPKSLKGRIDMLLEYHSLPSERAANEILNITAEDIIGCYLIRSGEVLSVKDMKSLNEKYGWWMNI